MAQRFPSSPDARPKFIACWKKLFSDSTRKVRLQFYASVLWYHSDTVGCNIEATRIYQEKLFGSRKACIGVSKNTSTSLLEAVRASFRQDLARYIVVLCLCHLHAHHVDVEAHHISVAAQLHIRELRTQDQHARDREMSRLQAESAKRRDDGSDRGDPDDPDRHADAHCAPARSAREHDANRDACNGRYRDQPPMQQVVLREVQDQARKTKRNLLSVVPAAGLNESNVSPHASPSLTPLSATAEPGIATAVPQSPNAAEEFEIWRLRLLHYHAAEVYIGIFAEYVAFGCSYVIVIFCWNYPKYMLSSYHGTTSSSGDDVNGVQRQSLSMVMGDAHVVIVGLQLSAEVFVDCISCLLEIGNGINFQPLQRQGFFIAVLLI